jgi:hypothetical protein
VGSSPGRVKPKTIKHTALRSKSKDWMAWNQNNVSEWRNMSYLWINLPLDVITGQTRNRQGIAEILLKVEQNIIDKHDHGT